MCTGEQVNELTCYVCEETKGLGDFAKAQRRDPDAAVCYFRHVRRWCNADIWGQAVPEMRQFAA